MNTLNPEQVISMAENERRRRNDNAQRALEWFLEDDHLGELYERYEAIDALSKHLDVPAHEANPALGALVGDIVDPVQQVMSGGDRHIGVIDYREWPDRGVYGYVDYDDRVGRRKRVVCVRCVELHDHDTAVSHATEGEGSVPNTASWEDLLKRVREHYDTDHDAEPSSVEVGASLISNTTISSNTAWYAGNDGPGSGLDADTVNNQEF